MGKLAPLKAYREAVEQAYETCNKAIKQAQEIRDETIAKAQETYRKTREGELG